MIAPKFNINSYEEWEKIIGGKTWPQINNILKERPKSFDEYVKYLTPYYKNIGEEYQKYLESVSSLTGEDLTKYLVAFNCYLMLLDYYS